VKNIMILFGEMGAGKSYSGKLIAKEMDLTFFDGDTVASSQMIEKVSKFRPLTREMVANFVDTLLQEIEKRASQAPGALVVAQALYFDQDRVRIYKRLTELGYRVRFYWIKPRFWRNLSQLWSRPKGLQWIWYWLINKPFFQKPTHPYALIP
jgi:gluconate kinase